MESALELAREAGRRGEVPVGAVLVRDGDIIGRGSNAPITDTDPTAHAEIVALRDGARCIKNYRLDGATLYCTVEPCLMCYGAAIHSRIERLVYGARDPKVGTMQRVAELRASGVTFNHAFETRGDVLGERSAELLVAFFRNKRSDGEVPKWS